MSGPSQSQLERVIRGRTVEQRLWNTDDALHTAMHGLELLQPHEASIEDPNALPAMLVGERLGLSDVEKFEIGRRLHMGLRIATTFGVATTAALQSLSGHAAGFDDWWSQRRAVLKADPASRYIWLMRVNVAHSGTTGLYSLMTQETFAPPKTLWAVWLEFPREFDGERRAHVLVEKYLAELGVIVSDAWAEFSPLTRSTGLR